MIGGRENGMHIIPCLAQKDSLQMVTVTGGEEHSKVNVYTNKTWRTMEDEDFGYIINIYHDISCIIS